MYRLTQFPTPARPDLMVWQLWSRNRQDEPQGVFSHATALTLHDLSDVMPAKLDMTVPPGFRRMTAIPGVLRLHHARLEGHTVRIYSLARTVADCFRFRNKIGLDVALEALADSWRGKRLKLDELNRIAKKLRVQRVMQPYLETVVL